MIPPTTMVNRFIFAVVPAVLAIFKNLQSLWRGFIRSDLNRKRSRFEEWSEKEFISLKELTLKRFNSLV